MNLKLQIEKSLKQEHNEESYPTSLKNLIKIRSNLFIKINFIDDLRKVLFLIKSIFKSIYKCKVLTEKVLEFYLKQITEVNMTSSNLNDKEMKYLFNKINGITQIRIEGRDIQPQFEIINKLSNLSNIGIESLILKESCLQPYNIGSLEFYKMTNLISIDLSHNNIGDDGIKIIANHDYSELIELNLTCNNITHIGADYLSSGKLSQLKKLNLSHNNIIDTGAYYLSNGNFYDLVCLNLEENFIQASGVNYLSRGNLENIKELNLSNNKIGSGGSEWLANGKFKKIEKLILPSNKIGRGAKFLNNYNFPNLKHLDIADNRVIIESLYDICKNSSWSQLEYLDLSQNFLGADIIKNLINGGINKIKTLNLSLNRVGDNGVKMISEADNFCMLENLDLTANAISDEGIKYISFGFLNKLKFLNLSSNRITDQGFIYIYNDNLEHLESLNLSANKLTKKSLNFLTNEKRFRELNYLNLFGSDLKCLNMKKMFIQMR